MCVCFSSFLPDYCQLTDRITGLFLEFLTCALVVQQIDTCIRDTLDVVNKIKEIFYHPQYFDIRVFREEIDTTTPVRNQTNLSTVDFTVYFSGFVSLTNLRFLSKVPTAHTLTLCDLRQRQ